MGGTRNGQPRRGKGLSERVWRGWDWKHGRACVWGEEWCDLEIWDEVMIYFSFFRLQKKSRINKLTDSAVSVMHGRKISKTCIHVLLWYLVWIQTFLHFRRKWTDGSTYGCVESHVFHPCFRIVVHISCVHARIWIVWNVKWVWFLLWLVHVHILFRDLYWGFVLFEVFELRFFGWNRVVRVSEIGVWQYFLDGRTFVGCDPENRLDEINLIRGCNK